MTAVNDAPTDLSTGIELNTDGGNDAYLISDTGLSQSLNATTVEIRFAATDTPLETVLMSFNNPAGDELSIQLDDPSNNLEIDFGAGTVAYASAIDYRAALVDGTVHTLSVTWDNTAGNWSVYIDGAHIESGTGLSVGTALDTTNGQFVFGQEQDGLDSGYDSSQCFSGTIYDVRIWNDVRSAGEIAQHYQQQLDLTPAEAAAVGLVANWQMDGFDGSSQVVDIVSGNNLSIAHASGTGFTAGTVNAQLSIDENSTNGSYVGFVTAQDPDAGETFSFSLTDSAGGRFAVNTSTGEITVANSSLLDYESSATHNITVRVTDSGGLTYDEVLTIQVNNLEDVPVNQVPGAQSTNEDTTLTFNAANGNLISIADDAGEPLVVTVAVNNGTVTLSGTTGLTFTAGDGTGDATMTFSGTVEDINAALDGLQYDPTADYSGSDTFTITSYDQTLYSLDLDANLQGPLHLRRQPCNDAARARAGRHLGSMRP
ncbi:MAG: cadherin domain-containing protein [Nitrospira sp.]|nr:cadherin domain-containing protein [Nitrospira sp.]